MKKLFHVFLLTFFIANSCIAMDSSYLKQNHIELSIQLGQSEHLMLNNFKGQFYKNDYNPSFLRFDIRRKRLSFSVSTMRYTEKLRYATPQNAQSGFKVNTQFKAWDFGLNYTLLRKNNKWSLSGGALCSWRPQGGEVIVISDKIYHRMGNNINYWLYGYGYRSFGLGVNLQFKKMIWKNLFLTTQMQMNHYFQKVNQHASMAKWGEEGEDYLRNYNINKNLMTFVVALGYNFKLKYTGKPNLNY